ncbi:MAG: rod shape-determining protein MreD [Verrucomicrobiae bacterium]|nr:rod shape-determining protein MreD [Verrucomicrobiae bacterium]
MNWVHPTSLMFSPVLLAFAQWRWDAVRGVLSAQPDLMPALVVYAALSSGLGVTVATAMVAGLAADTVSSGPFGLSVLPLATVGLVLHLRRDLLLRDSVWAQALLGGAGSLVATALTLALLFLLWPLVSHPGPGMGHWPERQPGLTELPTLGMRSIWQVLVVTAAGTVATPVIFRLFRWIDGAFQYRRIPDGVYRANREIKRGRF